MPPYNAERYYDAKPRDTWRALDHIAKHKYRVTHSDERSLGVSFKTGVTAFTAGQAFEAAVIPHGAGALVRLAGSSKVSTNLGNGAAQAKVAEYIFGNLGTVISQVEQSQN